MAESEEKSCHDSKVPVHRAAGFRLYGDYDEGDIVKLQQLQGRAQWNGQFAKVVKYVPDKQRYHVVTTISSSQSKLQPALLRGDNLSLVYSVKHVALSKQCITCTKTMDVSDMIDCPFCRSIFYCSNKCKKTHFEQKDHLRFMCGMYRQVAEHEHAMIERTEKLFEFQNLVREDMTVWLRKYGLLFKGIWKRLYWDKNDGLVPYGALMKRFAFHKQNDYVFWAFGGAKEMKKVFAERGERYIPVFNDENGRFVVQNEGNILKNWRAYFKLKEIHLKSPIAHFMSYVMTVYYGLTKFLRLAPIIMDKAAVDATVNAREIVIHLVGVEIELDIMHLYCELLCVLPGYNFTLCMFAHGERENMIAKDIQPETTFKIKSSEHTLKVLVRTCRYDPESVKETLPKPYQVPHLLFGLNAGFEGYRDWEKALQQICRKQIPSIFTEYTVSTVQSATINLKQWTDGVGQMDEIYKINPFRSSIITFNPVSRFSSVKNGWIYTLFTNKLRKKNLNTL